MGTTRKRLVAIAASFAAADVTFFLFPALAIAILVLSFNLMGDGLRDALDPKADR